MKWLAHILALAVTLSAAGGTHAATPGSLPNGVTVFPTEDSQAVRLIETAEPADFFAMGPLPDLSLRELDTRAGRTFAILTGDAGTYNVFIFPDSGKPKIQVFAIKLGAGSKPPDPPIPTTGFRILFLEESGKRSLLTAAQARIPADPAIRDYLDTHGDYRILDPKNDTSNDSKDWKDLLARPRQSDQWLIASNPANTAAPSYEGPWPPDPPAALALLQKIGGKAQPLTRAAPPLDLSRLPIINAANFKQYIGDGQQITINGKTRRFGMRPRRPEFAAAAALFSRPFDLPVIPRAEWSQRIKEGKGTWLSDIYRRYKVPVLDQDGLNYCHAFSPAEALIGLQAWQCGHWQEISGGSIGGPATGYVNEGAWIGDDLKVLTDLGAATVKFCPQLAVRKSDWLDFTNGQKDALFHRVPMWLDLEPQNFAQVMTCLLTRKPVCVGLNWWSHAITYMDPVETAPNVFGVLFRNSWGADYGDDGWAILAEDKATPDEAYVPEQVYSLAL